MKKVFRERARLVIYLERVELERLEREHGNGLQEWVRGRLGREGNQDVPRVGGSLVIEGRHTASSNWRTCGCGTCRAKRKELGS